MTTRGAEADRVEFLALLTRPETEALEQIGRRRDWSRGSVLFHSADRSDWIGLLLSGRVKVSWPTSAGVEVVLAIRGPGALLGELSAIDREPRSATVTALEPVSALVVPLVDFEAYLHNHTHVMFLLLRLLAGRLRDADRKRIEFGAHDATGRVAARLVEMAERFGEPTEDGLRIELPFSQDDLAGWTGTSRESVSKALGVLRGRGWITTSRLRIVVRDIEALRTRAR